VKWRFFANYDPCPLFRVADDPGSTYGIRKAGGGWGEILCFCIGLAGDSEITGFLNYCDLFLGRVPYIAWGRCHEQIHRGHLLKVARLRRGSPRPDSRRDGSDVIGPAGQAIRSEQGASNSACRTKRCNHSCDATALLRDVRSGILSRTNRSTPDRATGR